MDAADIEKRFTYHPPKDGQSDIYVMIRDAAKQFAYLIDFQAVDSREKSLAITALEEAVFWANAAIARNS